MQSRREIVNESIILGASNECAADILAKFIDEPEFDSNYLNVLGVTPIVALARCNFMPRYTKLIKKAHEKSPIDLSVKVDMALMKHHGNFLRQCREIQRIVSYGQYAKMD